ncbi:MAG: glycosyltransferase [Candidatus Kaelpia aquatica]|nr:glycosyltransferase [Candidatus Kaelpia aquatica]
MNDPKVVVVIAAFNAGQFIGDCLNSLESQDYSNLDVYVVDNNSRDNTSNIVQEFKSVKLVRNKTNRGVCSARNRVIRSTESKYLLTLDSDMILDKGFISTIVRGAENSNSNVGMWGGTAVSMRDKESIDSLGIKLSRFYRFYDVGSGENISDLERVWTRGILGPCACAGLYLRKMLESIKIDFCSEFFDSKMHYLVEDFDVAMRARKKGWGFKYIKDATSYHYRHGSKIAPEEIRYLSFRNRYYLIIKHFSFRNLPYLILSLFFYDLPRVFYLAALDYKMIKRSLSDLNAML